MNVLLLVLVAALAVAVGWLAFEVLRVRRRVEGLPLGDEELYGLVQRLQAAGEKQERWIAELGERVTSLELRLPRAVQRVGSISYDAYGDVAGTRSQSIAFLDEEGTGVVISQLVGREESRLFLKGVREGLGDDPLSPEEAAAVRQAMGG